MDVTALARFLERTQIELRAERAGVDVDRWRGAPLDVALLKALHTAVVGKQAVVRRLLVDGSAVLAAAQPGHVRTKPQAFRVGDHVEAAWEQGRLKTGLIELCQAAQPLLAGAPVKAAAMLVWRITRAQPFTGLNERTALVLANWVLRGVGLPPLNVEEVEKDRRFEDALLEVDWAGLESYFVDKVWDEALRLAEGVRVTSPVRTQRWTLADEHAAVSTARAHATKIPSEQVAAFVDHVSDLVAQDSCGLSIADGKRETLDEHAARQSVAWQAGFRGRFICPHEPIIVARWSVNRSLQLVLVVGAVGRGTTGAASAHLAIELPGQPVSGVSPAMLLVVDEDRDERHVRTRAWVERALPRAIEQCPIRI